MTTRRDFLQTLGAAGAASLVACSGSGGGGGGTPPTPPTPPQPSASNILVMVQIQGGNDFLNTAPPNAGADAGLYATLRPTLRIPDDRLLDLGSGVAMNRALLGFENLQAKGRVAWIPGIGMANPNLSHFTSTDLWGMGSGLPTATGWLGRWGDARFQTSDTLRGLSLTSDLLLMLHGQKRDFVAITGASDYAFPAWLRSTSAVPEASLHKSGYLLGLNAAQGDPAAGLAATEGRLFYDAQATFQSLIKPRTPAVSYPGDPTYPTAGLSNQLSSQLKLVAQMIASDLPTQVYCVRMGGFDTHSNQATDHPRLLGALGGAIAAFLDDLETLTTAQGPAADRVVVAAWSEFGRRAKENNGGTDHGTAGLAFCAGKPVKGGVYGGGYPSLASLDPYGNLKYSTDFRSLYASLIEGWIGGDSAAILGGTYPVLSFLSR